MCRHDGLINPTIQNENYTMYSYFTVIDYYHPQTKLWGCMGMHPSLWPGGMLPGWMHPWIDAPLLDGCIPSLGRDSQQAGSKHPTGVHTC